MSEAPPYRRIMSGEAGLWAAPLRAGLWVASCAYAAVVGLRNRRYDRNPSQVERLPVPVISVGNITTGGTGKTPLVIDLVDRLRSRGRRPAVVSRGYRAQPNRVGDELLLVRRRATEVITEADPDRVTGGLRAVARGANAIVLDDAFQHRRVHRDLDIVVIDATCPFGHGHVLPRGLLREPINGLARADLIVLSRTDAAQPDHIEAVDDCLRRCNAEAPILRSRHRPTHVSKLDGGRADVETLRGQPVVCVAGIGNPGAFVRTVEQVGATPLHTVRLPDHASYDAAVYKSLEAATKRFPDAKYLVTTEKDLVKLEPGRWAGFPLPIAAVVIDIDVTREDGRILDAALDRLIAQGRDDHLIGCKTGLTEDGDARQPIQTNRSE